MTDKLKTWPGMIFIHAEHEAKTKDIDFNDVFPLDASWGEHQIENGDVKYVRVDLVREREEKLIMACFNYCNVPIASDKQIYADAKISQLEI